MRTDARRQEALERVGTRIGGKWFLDEMLGFGGCATVYAATHRNGARAAVKLLHPDVMSDAILRTRFVREGYVANKVKHAGVVAVLDDDVTEEGLPYLVMELLEGRSLERPVGGDKKLAVHEMVRVADVVLDVLISAHAAGIVHRDLKPANIFLTTRGQVKVLDFGIARLAETSRDPEQTGATQTGIMMGTATYMPPEQARGRWDDVDGRSDLFAVGATMLALVLGRRPRQADTTNEDFLMAMTEGMPPTSVLAPEIPKPIADVIDRACAFKRDDRWADAAAMQSALRDAVTSHAAKGMESATRLQVKTKIIVGDAGSGSPSGMEHKRTLPASPLVAPGASLAPASSREMETSGGSTTSAAFVPGSLPPGGRSSERQSSLGVTAFVIACVVMATGGLVLGGIFLRARHTPKPTFSSPAPLLPAETAEPSASAAPMATPVATEVLPPKEPAAPASNAPSANTPSASAPGASAPGASATTPPKRPKPRTSPAPADSNKIYDERF